jgi:predicted ferric reductase
VPGLSEYRSAPVALGTLGLYATIVAGISARWTRLLPSGLWLRLHRLALVAWILGWLHGLTAGTDALPLLGLYVVSGAAVVGAGAYRYWVSKKARPTFATSLTDADRRATRVPPRRQAIAATAARTEEAA